jgi:uncharacterized protein
MHSMRLPIALMAASAAIPASAAEIQIPVQGPVIELTVSQTVNAKPDIAILGAGVTTRADSANESARLNAERMKAIIERLRQLGIASEDIQTLNFSINPQYQYTNDGQQPRFLGHDTSNQVSVKIRKLDKIGPVLDALVAAGANNFFGPNFSLEKDKEAKSAARRAAYADAQTRSRELAGLAGYANVRLLEISETYSASGVMQGGGGGNDIIVTTVSAQKITPIEPGQVGTSATLTVKYEMTR